MSAITKYKVTFPVQKVDVAESYPYPLIREDYDGKAVIPAPAQIRIPSTQTTLTFAINKVKCRLAPAVIYFKWYGLDYHKNVIAEYTSERMVVTTEYTVKQDTFDIPYKVNPDTNKNYDSGDLDQYYFELYMLGVTSENPIYFNNLQLNEDEYKEYHKPNDEKNNVLVGFERNTYINLYDESEIFLQVIRPNREDIRTETLTKAQMTILAPHLPNESVFDDPLNLFYEFMYMTEQRIGVEK